MLDVLSFREDCEHIFGFDEGDRESPTSIHYAPNPNADVRFDFCPLCGIRIMWLQKEGQKNV